MGLALGGSIVIDFALAHPQMIETLILVVPDVTGYAFSPEFTYGFIKVVTSIEPDDGSPAGDMWLESSILAPTMENPTVARKLRLIARENARWWLINPLFRRDVFVRPEEFNRAVRDFLKAQ